jgi:Domain of unknown function (DUF4440)
MANGGRIEVLKNGIPGTFFIFLVWMAGCAVPSVSEEELSIRTVREESNGAIAAHDTVVLTKALTPDYNVVTSRNSVSADRPTMLKRLSADWSTKPDLVYHRKPTTINVFPAWRMAGEQGTWTGRWTEPNGDKIVLFGEYYAKWHRIGSNWFIRAEIFTPLRCEGGTYCNEGPLDK